MLRDAVCSNCSSALASRQQAFTAFSNRIWSNFRRGKMFGQCFHWLARRIHFHPRQTFNLVSTKPALPLANQPMLTSRASSLACPRQKPVWSSYGCKHHPGAAALPEVKKRRNSNTRTVSRIPWQRAARRENETYELTPPGPAFLSSVLCLNGVLL